MRRGRLRRGFIRWQVITARTCSSGGGYGKTLGGVSGRRRRIRQDLETGDLETLPLEHPDPDQLERLQTEHTSKEVRKGLAKLPDRARMALTLRYFADMSYDEIADTLGVRRAFVGVLLLRARHQLRDALSEGGASRSRGATAGGTL